jgi:hypothetical protein
VARRPGETSGEPGDLGKEARPWLEDLDLAPERPQTWACSPARSIHHLSFTRTSLSWQSAKASLLYAYALQTATHNIRWGPRGQQLTEMEQPVHL